MYQVVVTLTDGTKIVKAKNLRFVAACDRLKVELDKAIHAPFVKWVDMVEQERKDR